MVAAVLVAGSEKAAAHRLGLSHSTVKHHLANARSKVGAETTAQLVWILAPRLPEPEGMQAHGKTVARLCPAPSVPDVWGASGFRSAEPSSREASIRLAMLSIMLQRLAGQR